MKPKPCLLVFATAILLLLPACDGSGGDGDDNAGKAFTVTVTGSRTESFGGSALAVETHDNGDVSWGVILSDPDTGFKIIFAWDGATPGNGQHQVSGQSTASVLEAILTLNGVLDQYVATSGMVTVTSSSATRVVGSFSFSATYGGLDSALAGTTVTVAGDFSATNVIDDGTS